MNLNKLFLTNNDCYKTGKKITVKGIMVHSTGANNPWLKRYLPDDGKIGKNQYGNHWNTARPGGAQVCVHGFIGKLANGTVATYQTLPWNHRGWHAGGGANNTHIGFEICEDGLNDRAYFEKVYKEATELCAYLCKEYGLTEKDIIDHSEGYKKGIASNHGDVKHWFTKHGKSMDTFRADVKKLLNNSAVEEEDDMGRIKTLENEVKQLKMDIKDLKSKMIYNYIDTNMPDWAIPTVAKLKNKGYLQGGEDGKLNLDETMLRILVINDRAGLYD